MADIANLAAKLSLNNSEFNRGCEQSAQVMGKLQKSVEETNKSGGIGGRLAAGFGDLKLGAMAQLAIFETVKNEIVSNISALGEWLTEGDRVFKQQSRMAREFDTTVEAMQTMSFAARRLGIEDDALSNALSRLARRIGEAKEGSEEARSGFAALGLDWRRLSTVPLDTAWGMFAQRLNAVGNATDRAHHAQQNLGRGYREVMPLLQRGSQFIEDSHRRLDQAGALTTEAQAATVRAQFLRLNEVRADLRAQELAVLNRDLNSPLLAFWRELEMIWGRLITQARILVSVMPGTNSGTLAPQGAARNTQEFLFRAQGRGRRFDEMLRVESEQQRLSAPAIVGMNRLLADVTRTVESREPGSLAEADRFIEETEGRIQDVLHETRLGWQDMTPELEGLWSNIEGQAQRWRSLAIQIQRELFDWTNEQFDASHEIANRYTTEMQRAWDNINEIFSFRPFFDFEGEGEAFARAASGELERVRRALGTDNGPQFASALQRGSADYVSAINQFRAGRGEETPQEEALRLHQATNELQAQQLATQRRNLEVLEEIRRLQSEEGDLE